MNKITIIYTYYENKQMLERQLRTWNNYSTPVCQNTKFILVDDGSPNDDCISAVRLACFRKDIDIEVYKIHEDIPWHQLQARNLAAHVAPEGWLFLSDICRVLPRENATQLINTKLREDTFYKFRGMQMPSREFTYQHPNTLLVTKDNYWKAGGYNSAFTNCYGGDGSLINDLHKVCHFENLPIWLEYHDYIEDSKTKLPRKEGIYRERYLELKKSGKKERHLNFKWERLL